MLNEIKIYSKNKEKNIVYIYKTVKTTISINN